MSESQLIGSRYIIKYNPNTNKTTFYLAGATHDNRQGVYANILNFLINLQSSVLSRLFSTNEDVVQDINITDSYLLPDLINERLTIKFYHPELYPDGIDIGIVPKDKDLESTIIKTIESYDSQQIKQAFKLIKIKKNAWNSDTLLIGISFENYTTGKTELVKPIQPVIKEDVISIQNLSIEKIPSFIDFDSFEKLEKFILSQFCSYVSIRNLNHVFNSI